MRGRCSGPAELLPECRLDDLDASTARSRSCAGLPYSIEQVLQPLRLQHCFLPLPLLHREGPRLGCGVLPEGSGSLHQATHPQQLTPAARDHFGLIWTILDDFELFWTILDSRWQWPKGKDQTDRPAWVHPRCPRARNDKDHLCTFVPSPPPSKAVKSTKSAFRILKRRRLQGRRLRFQTCLLHCSGFTNFFI